MGLGDCMKTATERYELTEEDGYVTFIAEVIDKDEYHVNITLNEVTSWQMDKTVGETEQYLQAYIKWDGCSHVCFGENENDSQATTGYLHLCGALYWKRHATVMLWLYELASRLITHFEEDERLE